MSLASVEGQPHAVEPLRAALRLKAVHHALLFQGPEGVGKELAAVGLAQALTCPEYPWEGCGRCSSCSRVAKRNHPDVQWVMPEEELVARGLAGRSDFSHVPSREIRIEQVRRLQERLSYRALEAAHKVVLLVTAHAMNVPAQNALLKTLEEPPRDTVLVLVSASPERLLPTIRSRCAKITFGPLSAELISKRVAELRKVDATVAGELAAMSGGSLARALALDVGVLAARRRVIETFESLEADDARGWLALAETLAEDRETAEGALETLQVWVRDVAVVQAGGAALLNADLSSLAERSARRASGAVLQRWSELMGEARVAISQRNGSPRLQLERMLIEMLRA
jgi:DNA polymerase-3 subunit delta'